MNIDIPRGQSASPSANSSRSFTVLSNVFSKECMEYIQALNNSPT